MKKFLIAVFTLGLVAAPNVANAQMYLIGQDKSFLGEVTASQTGRDSICNQVSAYGSQVGRMSIFNQVSYYGSQVSDYSAYNRNATKPPVVVYNGNLAGVVTKNRQRFQQHHYVIDPDVLRFEVCGR